MLGASFGRWRVLHGVSLVWKSTGITALQHFLSPHVSCVSLGRYSVLAQAAVVLVSLLVLFICFGSLFVEAQPHSR